MNKFVYMGIAVVFVLALVMSIFFVKKDGGNVIIDTVTKPIEQPLGNSPELPKLKQLKCTTKEERLTDPNCKWVDDALKPGDRP